MSGEIVISRLLARENALTFLPCWLPRNALATSSEAAATTSQTTTGNLVEDTLQSPGALTGRRVPLYERSGEGKRASASGLVETSASAELAQSDGDPLGGDLGEDAGPARLDGDES